MQHRESHKTVSLRGPDTRLQACRRRTRTTCCSDGQARANDRLVRPRCFSLKLRQCVLSNPADTPTSSATARPCSADRAAVQGRFAAGAPQPILAATLRRRPFHRQLHGRTDMRADIRTLDWRPELARRSLADLAGRPRSHVMEPRRRSLKVSSRTGDDRAPKLA